MFEVIFKYGYNKCGIKNQTSNEPDEQNVKFLSWWTCHIDRRWCKDLVKRITSQKRHQILFIASSNK